MIENSDDVAKRGVSQAESSLGGVVPLVVGSSPLEKVYDKSIRLLLNPMNIDNRKVTHSEIYKEIANVYGRSSKEVVEIAGIGKGANELEWIVSYKNGFPSSFQKANVYINGFEVKIEDAGKRVVPKINTKLPVVKKKRDMLFRIDGLPLDAGQNELFNQLNALKIGIADPKHMRQIYDRITNIRTEVVMFRLFVEEEMRDKEAMKAGDYEILLGGFKFKIKIKCYGYCFRCKKSGHLAKDCDYGKSCFECGSLDHMKRECPVRIDELFKKKQTQNVITARKLVTSVMNVT